MVDALFQMSNLTKQNGIPDQTINVIIFFLQLMGLQEIFEYLATRNSLVHIVMSKRKS
jgi:hypothetical protein